MKTRIISALVGLIILGVAIAFYDTIIFNLFITALAVIGIYEGHHAASLTKKHWRVTLYSMLFAVLILLIPHGRSYIMPAVYALVVLVFAYILEHHKVFTIREGAYALLMGVGLPVVFGLILQFRDQFINPLTLHFGRICLLTPLLALLSVVGDLSFSIIKRTYGIKDYGNLMPGHGGVLDRFDSVLFITPAVYFIATYWPIAF